MNSEPWFLSSEGEKKHSTGSTKKKTIQCFQTDLYILLFTRRNTLNQRGKTGPIKKHPNCGSVVNLDTGRTSPVGVVLTRNAGLMIKTKHVFLRQRQFPDCICVFPFHALKACGLSTKKSQRQLQPILLRA